MCGALRISTLVHADDGGSAARKSMPSHALVCSW
jgi:hypothetical protein